MEILGFVGNLSPAKKITVAELVDELSPLLPGGGLAADLAGLTSPLDEAAEEILSAALGGGLPEWWTVVSTEDAEMVTFGGRVRISPTDQTDDPGEGLLVVHTTDDLVNQSNHGAVFAALIKPENWATPGVPDLAADSFLMLHVLGITINTPVEEGEGSLIVKARGVDPFAKLSNSGLILYEDESTTAVTITPTSMIHTGLPTVDPVQIGQLWVDPAAAFVVKQSQGV